MNKIKMTKSLLEKALSGVFSTSGGDNFGSGANNFGTILRVYKGTVPTAQEITDMASSSFTNARAGDLLLTFTYTSLFDAIVGNTAKLKTSTYSPASQSGVATFFILYVYPTSNPNGVNSAIVGTISDAAGSGDLKLTSTNIVSGQQYRVQPLNFAVPLQYTY